MDKETVWENICQKVENEGQSSLNNYERISVNVDGLIGNVSGGGLISFFYNHGADNYKETIEDLVTIGADSARNEIIDSWDHDELS